MTTSIADIAATFPPHLQHGMAKRLAARVFCPKCGRTPQPPNRLCRAGTWCIDCKRDYGRAWRREQELIRNAGIKRLFADEPTVIDEDPVKYAARCRRIQVIVDRVDRNMEWPSRVVLPNRPGEPADIVEAQLARGAA